MQGPEGTVKPEPEPEPPSPWVPGGHRLEIHLTARAGGPGAGAGAGAAAASRQRSQCCLAGLGSAREPVGTRRRPRAPSPRGAEPKGTPQAALGGGGTAGELVGHLPFSTLKVKFMSTPKPHAGTPLGETRGNSDIVQPASNLNLRSCCASPPSRRARRSCMLQPPQWQLRTVLSKDGLTAFL
ncbi:uncharacterized protein WM277_020291 [Molossus nigricans]